MTIILLYITVISIICKCRKRARKVTKSRVISRWYRNDIVSRIVPAKWDFFKDSRFRRSTKYHNRDRMKRASGKCGYSACARAAAAAAAIHPQTAIHRERRGCFAFLHLKWASQVLHNRSPISRRAYAVNIFFHRACARVSPAGPPIFAAIWHARIRDAWMRKRSRIANL